MSPPMGPSSRGEGAAAVDPPSIGEVARTASAQFEDLTGRRVEGVTSVTRNDDGYRVGLEAVELERIPESTNILGCYELIVDRDGSMREFVRVGRYHKNQAEAQEY